MNALLLHLLLNANRVVFGYLPYWTGSPVRWDTLTHVAYFSSSLHADLSWNDHQFRPVEAKLHGVKPVLTITNFSKSEIAILVGSKRAAAVAQIVSKVKEHEMEGVNIDFEFVPATSADDFVLFMEGLTQAMHAAIPGSHVSFASPSTSRGGAYDYRRLLQVTDAVVVMFYGCHYTGSTKPGPLAPLSAGSRWSKTCNLEYVSRWFAAQGAPERVIMGLPFYGIEWPDGQKGKAKTWSVCKQRYAQYGRLWDSDSQTSFARYASSQLWCDDGESLALKVQQLITTGLGGMGIWALGYEGNSDEYWSAMAALRVDQSAPSMQTPTMPTGATGGTGEAAPDEEDEDHEPTGNSDSVITPPEDVAPEMVEQPPLSFGVSGTMKSGCNAVGSPLWLAVFVMRMLGSARRARQASAAHRRS